MKILLQPFKIQKEKRQQIMLSQGDFLSRDRVLIITLDLLIEKEVLFIGLCYVVPGSI